MIKLLKFNLPIDKKNLSILKEKLYQYIDGIDIPYNIKHIIFGDQFFDNDFYLVSPTFFTKALNSKNSSFTWEICISGFFYFKYLLSIDTLNDQDIEVKNKDILAKINKQMLLQSHIYHEEAMKILSTHFSKNKEFWKIWNQRNSDFLKSIMIDSEYNPDMEMDVYEELCIKKCSFSAVAIDAQFFKISNKNTEIYDDLIKANNYFSIARCIQDDIEDFRKDLIFKKNNLGHIRLSQWLKKQNKNLNDYSVEELEKLFIISEELENLLRLSKEYYKKAQNICMRYENQLQNYIDIIKSLIKSLTFFIVQTEGYRIDVLHKAIRGNKKIRGNTVENSLNKSYQYIAGLKSSNGYWYEIMNKQGLSNVWSTAFISSFLDDNDPIKLKAANLLNLNKQNHLWGYNTEWSYDYDSTTNVLNVLSRYDLDSKDLLDHWIMGQRPDGGFSTYNYKDSVIKDNLGLKQSLLKGWVQSHVCVSALSYFHLTKAIQKYPEYTESLKKVKDYLFSNMNKSGYWDSYWWSSGIYSTSFIIQGMLCETTIDYGRVINIMEKIMKMQNNDGSFSCELSNEKSCFYSAMVLNTLCSDQKLFNRYRSKADKIVKWLLKKQYEDGRFPNTDFLVMPNPNQITWNSKKHNFVKNKFGGGNTITGEQYGLFTTAVAYRGLKSYIKLTSS